MIATLLATLVSGCATTPVPNPVSPVVNRKILQTAQSVHQEISSLLAIDQANVHPHTAHAPQHGPLARHITLLWSGPMAPAVKAVAELIGYHYRVEGAPPIIMPIIRIHATREHAFDVLRNIGLQAGRHAGVIIDHATHTLVISYHEHGLGGTPGGGQ